MATVLIEASGTQTAVIGTEHSLATVADAKISKLFVDVSALALGDELELRVKVAAASGGTRRQVSFGVYQNVQEDGIIVTEPFAAPYGAEYTLKQTAGTARTFPWVVISVAGGPTTMTFPVTIAQGGTGADDAAEARTNLDVFSKGEVQGHDAAISLDGLVLANECALWGEGVAGRAAVKRLVRRGSDDNLYVGDGYGVAVLHAPQSIVTGQLVVQTGATITPALPAASGGVPAGGTIGQVLAKTSSTDLATAWTTPTVEVIAIGFVTGSSGTLASGSRGIASVSRSSAGVYVVTWSAARSNATYCVIAQNANVSGAYTITVTLATGTITVRTYNPSGVAADTDFTVAMF